VVKFQMIRENDHAVGRGEFLIAEPDGIEDVPVDDDRGDVGVRVPDLRPALLELREHLKGGGLPCVDYPALVRHPERQNPGAVETTALAIQALLHEPDHIRGHGAVDLVGEVDEAGLIAVEPHLPGKIAGIDRNAVPADSRPGIEWEAPERLGGGGLDNLAGAAGPAPA